MCYRKHCNRIVEERARKSKVKEAKVINAKSQGLCVQNRRK
jgi:hypothetical protein